jgi:hypothetical protein
MHNMTTASVLSTAVDRADTFNDVMSYVQRLIFKNDTNKNGTAASAAGHHIKLLEETTHPTCSHSTNWGKETGRSKPRGRCQEQTAANNPYKYCHKWKRHNCHTHIDEEQCFLNKTLEGYRPHYCCKEMSM